MSLQERTLVIRNFDPEKTTSKLLKELCIQGGPVRNVVVKPDHAFVEYEDVESVGYSKALLDGVELFGKKLSLEPKTRSYNYFKYCQLLQDYIQYNKQQLLARQQQQQMLAYCTQQIPQVPPQQHPANIQYQVPPPQVAQSNDPILNPNVNFVQEGLFNFSPLTQASNHLMKAQYQQPSTSTRIGNEDLRRSRSFNQQYHRRNNQINRSWTDRGRNRDKQH